MIHRFTHREQVSVSYGILAALLIVGVVLLTRAPIGERVAFFSRLDMQRRLYARSVAVIAEREAIDARQAADTDATPLPGLLSGETDALAGADLQNRVKAIIEHEGGVVVSSAFRRRDEELPLVPVTIVVRLQSSVEGLARILFELDHERAALFVENLTIQSRHRAGRPLRDPNEELDVELELTGFLAEDSDA